MRIWLICHLLLLCWASTARADLGKLEYLTEEYPPYNFSDPQGQPTGLAVDLLQMIWQHSGVMPQPVRILPWARGYYLLTQKPNVVLFSTPAPRRGRISSSGSAPSATRSTYCWAAKRRTSP